MKLTKSKKQYCTLLLRLYRGIAYMYHCLTAWNTQGEGIHSPYLFRVVQDVLYDSNAYYLFPQIEKKRQSLLMDNQQIFVDDFGTGKSETRKVCDIARSSLETIQIGQILFKLVQVTRAQTIVELGTSLGISTAYLAGGNKNAKAVSFEGSQSLIDQAQRIWKQLGIENITAIQGNIDEQLPKWLTCCSDDIDLAYVDANHTEEATKHYVQWLLPRMGKKSVLVLDDIYHSPQMTRAWQWVKHLPIVTSTMDLFHVGLVFFDSDFLTKDYKLRI